MSGNNRVTTQEFYAELLKVKDSQNDLRVLMEKFISASEVRLEDNAKEIDILRKRSDRWDLITNGFVVILTSLRMIIKE
jgi:hypothetical protein